MIKKPARMIRRFFSFFRPKFRPKSRLGREAMAVAFLVVFVFGYTLSIQQSEGFIIAPSKWTCIPICDPSGTASALGKMLSSSLKSDLSTSANDLETHLGDIVDDTMENFLTRINTVETDVIAWWNTMWFYNLLPSLQSMTDQLNTAITDQSRTLQSGIDAGNENETKLAMDNSGLESHLAFRPSENACVAATTAGGYGRASNISRAMRRGWEKESVAAGLNKKGTVGAASAIDAEKQRFDDYKNIFCDPDDNGGQNECGGSSAPYYNADTQPTKFIYNKLTIDVQTDPKMAKTVETIVNNLVGVPSADPISRGSLESATGQQVFLDRRSYLARYAATRTVPQIIAGWRMPGSQMGQWVKDLRTGAGVPLSDISDNPSYREVIHAATIDRFNSGRYAVGMITDPSEIEMEKLTLNAFYLMQLRDYYELMERTALTLAVQVSIMADQVPLANAAATVPLKP